MCNKSLAVNILTWDESLTGWPQRRQCDARPDPWPMSAPCLPTWDAGIAGLQGWWYSQLLGNADFSSLNKMGEREKKEETYLVSICPWIRLQRSDSSPTWSVYFDSIMSHLWKGPPTWPFQWLALANSASMEVRTSFFWSNSALIFYTLTAQETAIKRDIPCIIKSNCSTRGIIGYTKHNKRKDLPSLLTTAFLIQPDGRPPSHALICTGILSKLQLARYKA